MRVTAILSVLLFSFCNLSAQNYNIAAYNFHQSILEAQQNIGKEVYYFNESATALNLKILKFELNKSIAFVENLEIYNNETTYHNAAKKLFGLYKDLTENEYQQLLTIIEDPELDFKEFKAKKQKIFESMKIKTAKVYPAFLDAQEAYCLKYKIKIE